MSNRTNRYSERMQTVLRFIEQHLDAPLPLAELARVANFSPCHFHRQFSAYTGTTPTALVRQLRLQRASMRLAFLPDMTVTEIALEAGYQNAESFSRAFRQMHAQTPSQFRQDPNWHTWQRANPVTAQGQNLNTNVEIVDFPQTRIAAVEYRGPEQQSLRATRQLIEWRRANGVPPGAGNTYGIHYSDPSTTAPEDYRLDIGVSFDEPIEPNAWGVIEKVIPGGCCACIRHLGSRNYIPEADYLYREWLPQSGIELRDFPLFFHYVNVGPDVSEAQMITYIYLPLN